MLNKMNYGKYAILLFSPQGIESIKSEMEDIGEPLVDINFGHGRYSYEIVLFFSYQRDNDDGIMMMMMLLMMMMI